ncbi:Uncharacterized membrane protein, possible Na+ channel or pump [Archaeoglobus sulfaticallidus PM70-1]|uniref:Uncharacterized membrane protein, possible Na+ channel or pump n=1 Tax=Archaeoglobus sulfaticallidus PM70-1 TaxID=387631 RepID=N0BNR3_9EURY|nr:DUF554 domain-containing protein [Archaeoglobus sulfaticallidus]AGK61970.1 Uncharacterized membrane protein, possible Na+ channel or pump [Archaeoglobus sulfaticallidus PM70-1]
MIGTIINSVTIVVASLFGMFIGSRLNPKLKESLMRVLGLVVVVIGLKMALLTDEVVILVGSILLGTAIGEVIGIESKLESFGRSVERRFEGSKFAEGFVSTTLLYCVGSMAVVGSIQEGLTGDYSLLLTKSLLDGFASIALASTLGIGVMFSSISVLVYQGSLTLLAGHISALMTEKIIAEITATGGVLIVAIGLRLMELIDLKPGNMLPSLLINPIILFLI